MIIIYITVHYYKHNVDSKPMLPPETKAPPPLGCMVSSSCEGSSALLHYRATEVLGKSPRGTP